VREQVCQINVSVANLYCEPGYQNEIVSQALLGELATVLATNTSFTRIKLLDEYEGWISNYQWVEKRPVQLQRRCLRSHFARVYESPDLNTRAIRDAVIGTYFAVIEQKNGWLNVELPDGEEGWAEELNFGPFPQTSRKAVKQLALEFLGYPYHWGGRSPKGFDCSGLTYTVFNLLGISIPRDSWMQHRDAKIVSENPLSAEMGDLFFFAESGDRITHVGIALGDGKILHARGLVRINSLLESDAHYLPQLRDTFVDVRTFF
jgi:cell wall-associated NlpC family hydrolase